MRLFNTVAGGERGGRGRLADAGVRAGEFRTTESEVFEIISNDRRRYALQVLQRAEREVYLRELAERVAAVENGKSVDDITTRERRSVETALRQFHLPKMANAGFVRYNAQRKTAELAVDEAVLSPYLRPGADEPFSRSTLLLAVGALAANGYLALLVGQVGVDTPLIALCPLVVAAATVLLGAVWAGRDARDGRSAD